jgi:hypothetical protein
MLLGLFITIIWIPGSEHNADGKVKTLEQWAVGRKTPNRFAATHLALFIQKIYHILVGPAGDDERDQRAEMPPDNEEGETEMRHIEELERRPGSFRDEGDEGGPNDMVNGRTEVHTSPPVPP